MEGAVSKIWLIARREYTHNLRKRSFLLVAFGMPLLVVGLMLLSIAVAERQATATGELGNIGYVDLAELILPGAASPDRIGLVVPAVEVPEEFVAFGSVEEADEAFRAERIGAYFVIPTTYWDDGFIQTYATADIPEGIEDQIAGFLRGYVAARAPAQYVERLSNPLEMIFRTVDGQLEITEEGGVGVIMLPIVFGVLFMMATLTTTQSLMEGVVEEKENRIMEILVTSSTPEQMLGGKVLGLGALGLTQVLVWGLTGVVAILVAGESSPFLQVLNIPPSFVVILLVYFVLGYLFYGAIMAGLGAAVTDQQEGRQLAGVFSIVTVLPLMLSITFMQDPNGTIPVLLSLLPFSAPVAMLMRLPLASVPLWQLGLSFVLLGLSTVAAVWVSAKVFRLGMLMYGKRLRLRDIWTVLRASTGRPAMMTTATDGRGKGGVA
jgi:ABC-2 type transport system permease protein